MFPTIKHVYKIVIRILGVFVIPQCKPLPPTKDTHLVKNVLKNVDTLSLSPIPMLNLCMQNQSIL